eukprot:2921195-Prorocentrum_lima.AAC.1
MFTVVAAARPCTTGGVGQYLSQASNNGFSMVEVRVTPQTSARTIVMSWLRYRISSFLICHTYSSRRK